MDHAFSSARGPGIILFDEDFDLPPPSNEPEVIEPVYSLGELNAAREEAAKDSRERALAEADASARMMASRALIAISDGLEAARAEAASIAEQSSEAIARLLMRCFATAFPALSARHGQLELTALLREILPALHREPTITVRVSPHVSAELATDVHALDADLAKRVRLIATDAVSPGDARIDWENGAATRDAASLWRQIENVLAPAGLLDPADPSNAPGPARAEHATKEHALAE
jgi:flagellar biosynthesis/type III secretory pathway protein FliH